MGTVKKFHIIVLILSSQMILYNCDSVYDPTRYIQAYTFQNSKVCMKIISAKSKIIKIKIYNKSDDTIYYPASFKLYKYKKGKWRKIKIISKTPKTLRIIKKNDSKMEKILCKKVFGKKLSDGKYKIKWLQSKKFKIG